MTQLEKTKVEAVNLLRSLCARCKDGVEHVCPVRQVTGQIEAISGIPVIVNSKLYHVVFN